MSQMKSKKAIFSIIVALSLMSTLVFVSPAWARESISTPFRENAEVQETFYVTNEYNLFSKSKEAFSEVKSFWTEITTARNAAVGKADAAIAELDGWLLDDEKESLIAYEETMKTAANMDVYNEALAAFDAVVAEVNERIANYVPPQTYTYSSNVSTPSYNSGNYSGGYSDFMRDGVVHSNGNKFTYYSQSVLPGGGLNIPGRHVDGGFVKDADGYIVVANSAANGTVVNTPFGKGKVYDKGTSGNHYDIYVQ